jgi:hypothetical protein
MNRGDTVVIDDERYFKNAEFNKCPVRIQHGGKGKIVFTYMSNNWKTVEKTMPNRFLDLKPTKPKKEQQDKPSPSQQPQNINV